MGSDSMWAVRPPSTSTSSSERSRSSSAWSRFRGTFLTRSDRTITSLHGDVTQPSSLENPNSRWSSSMTLQDPNPRYSNLKPKFQWVRGGLIGQGSYGKVYLALNGTTSEFIAVKQVELQTHRDPRQKEVVDALRSERNTLKDLDHPNIVRFLGFEEDRYCLSIFMEYVSGGTVGSCLQHHGPFDEEVTKYFTSQMLSGLEYLHSKGIIHRDLKADNILVEKFGACKISDFGISKQADDPEGRAFTGMKGTIFWMAPEVLDAQSSGGYDAKIDIWSIGCVVHEMWTGKRPWHGYDFVPVMLKVCKDKLPPPLPSNLRLPQEGADLRSKCFAVEPHQRPSAAQLQHHPYLVQRPGWSFKPSDIEQTSHPQKPPADSRSSRPKFSKPNSNREIRKRPSQPAIHQRQRSTPHVPPVPPIPPIPTARPSIPEDNTENRTLRAPTSSRYRLDTSNLPGPTDRPSSPPLVYITPPGSPKVKHTPQYHVDVLSSPSTSDSSTKWSRTRRRSFFVANPDGDRPPDVYVYTPPPLPIQSRHSASLSHSSGHDHLAPPGNHTIRSVKSLSAIYPVSDSDDDTDFDTSIWKKPPAKVNKDKEVHQRSSIASSHRGQDRRESALKRPFVEDIYKHLEEWFPDHDLDEPIIKDDGIEPSEGERRGIRKGKKSIRVAAEEQVRQSVRLQRRLTTKLWEGSLEEVGHLGQPD
ncbi:ste ste11 protein kinase [Moniliophthora roreri MCA 2997]|uniref:Ste ste11 protein kinase n=1 Tax=Moniliophthora roreri (strain MCA 2997) TaxID=1381753 RepID=V2Z220_MONRO|nr:ste ste11 protein kinase [Moniliophthora roreri MCA 2997]